MFTKLLLIVLPANNPGVPKISGEDLEAIFEAAAKTQAVHGLDHNPALETGNEDFIFVGFLAIIREIVKRNKKFHSFRNLIYL